MAIDSTGNFVPIVDLFAGPGGLGEGFSSLKNEPFRIAVSAEMESSAHQTLRLRAYYRILKRTGTSALNHYYRFCNGISPKPYADTSSEAAWIEAGKEALQLTLGNKQHNSQLDEILVKMRLGTHAPWVLIGGPPCQAYSLVGRARNKGKTDYKAENDHRHFLYREYLRIIQQYKPAVFVMENVKGILSSSVGGQQIFHTILRDLADPDAAMGTKESSGGYRIHSLTCPTYFEKSMNLDDIDARDFIIRSENYGVPQARHRVILLGIRDDINIAPSILKQHLNKSSVLEAIGSLPRLRSKLSKEEDNQSKWAETVRNHFLELKNAAENHDELKDLQLTFQQYAGHIADNMSSGSLRHQKEDNIDLTPNETLKNWYSDKQLSVWLNHESRSHMSSDLRRYAYAASFARVRRRSPSGHAEFTLLDCLRPNHENWESGKFKDRFRVQLADTPSTTITSHISKDGHYFIHPDPSQCRSLTVREAARLQTFPDNYFFQGNKTQQLHQVGNAVPPLLARQIAQIVEAIIK